MTELESPTPGCDGPLSGVRVAELGMLLAGPFAGRLLADYGAEVIKVEAPDRLDPMRDWGRTTEDGTALWWPTVARNKKLVTLDLRRDAGRDLFRALIAKCDVVLENFRPGTLERWGLPYAALCESRPGLILARLSGYGQSGPYASRPGFASAAEAMSGLRFTNGSPGEAPPRYGISLGDSLAGLFALQGILAALYHRDALGGQGQVVDISILESCFALTESAATEYARLGVVRRQSGSRLPGIAPSGVFRSHDGKDLVIAANQDSLFRRLCDAMGRPELASDARFSDHRARGVHQDEIESIVADWASRHSARAIEARLADAGVVCGAIQSIAEVVADPHVEATSMIVEHTDERLGSLVGPAVAPRFSETPGSVRWSGKWRPGADNAAVFGGLLGRPEGELEALQRAGII